MGDRSTRSRSQSTSRMAIGKKEKCVKKCTIAEKEYLECYDEDEDNCEFEYKSAKMINELFFSSFI